MQKPGVYRASETTPQPGEKSFGDLQWFEVFQDDQLQGLIRTAVAQNYDVRQAMARINAARAQLGLARADQFPILLGQPVRLPNEFQRTARLGYWPRVLSETLRLGRFY